MYKTKNDIYKHVHSKTQQKPLTIGLIKWYNHITDPKYSVHDMHTTFTKSMYINAKNSVAWPTLENISTRYDCLVPKTFKS